MKTFTPDDFAWPLGDLLDGDRELVATTRALADRHVALLVTGGIAAFRTPSLVRELRRASAQVQVFATPSALDFVTVASLEWASLRPVVTVLDARAQHVEFRPDVWLVAPASYSTLNKVATGIADNAVTTALASALGQVEKGTTQVLFAPAMHGTMVNAILRANLARLANLGCRIVAPAGRDGKALLPDDATLVAAVVAALR